MVNQPSRSREQNSDSLSESIFFVVGLLSPDQAARDDERSSLQAPKGLLLALEAELSAGTDDNHSSAIFTLGDGLVDDILVDEGDEVGQSFATASGGLGDDVLLAEDGLEAADLDVG